MTTMAGEQLRVADLLRLQQRELDALFRRAAASPVPDGEMRGTFLPLPGTRLGPIAARLGRLAWRGKVFDPATMTMRNRVTPLGLQAVTARIRHGNSWLDGEPCIILDYADTSIIAKPVRDELRCLQPGLYLGKAHVGGLWICDFALEG